jgi:hypothetical protein
LAYSLHTSPQRWNADSIAPPPSTGSSSVSVIIIADASAACFSTTSCTLCSDGTAGTTPSPGALFSPAGAASRQPMVLARVEEHSSGPPLPRLTENVAVVRLAAYEERRAHGAGELAARLLVVESMT